MDQQRPASARTDLRDVRFVVVDVETTGTRADVDELTEVAAVVSRGGQTLAHLQSLVHTTRPIPATIVALTGITNELVANAPPPQPVLERLARLLEGGVLVGHNVRFDRAFLTAAAERVGLTLPSVTTIDTVTLARALLDSEVPNHKLATLARALNLPEPRHRALADVTTTLALLYALIERAGSLGVTTLEDLASLRRPPRRPQSALRTQARELPSSPGLYYFRQGRQVLYVGLATDLRERVRSYFQERSRRHLRALLDLATDVVSCPISCELTRRVWELAEIQRLTPVLNRAGVRPAHARWFATPSGLAFGPWPRHAAAPPAALLAGLGRDVARAMAMARALLAAQLDLMDAHAARAEFEDAAAVRDRCVLIATRVAVWIVELADRAGAALSYPCPHCHEAHALSSRGGLLELGPSTPSLRAARILRALSSIAAQEPRPDLEGDLAGAVELVGFATALRRPSALERANPRERLSRATAPDRLSRLLDPFEDRCGESPHPERGAGVDHHDVERGVGAAPLEHLFEDGGVLSRRPASH